MKPKEFLKGYLKPKKISAEMEADPRKSFLGTADEEMKQRGTTAISKKIVESIATTDGGTMYPVKGSLTIKPSSTWSSTGASIYGGISSGSGWSGGVGTTLSSGSFGSSFTYKSYLEECNLSAYHQDILMKAICDKIATEGVRPSGYITWTSAGLGKITLK